MNEPKWLDDWWEKGIDPATTAPKQEYYGWSRSVVEATANRDIKKTPQKMISDACKRKVREWEAEDRGKILIEMEISKSAADSLLETMPNISDKQLNDILDSIKDAIIESRKEA